MNCLLKNNIDLNTGRHSHQSRCCIAIQYILYHGFLKYEVKTIISAPFRNQPLMCAQNNPAIERTRNNKSRIMQFPIFLPERAKAMSV